jgi:cytochrome c biogenesis protein CcmG, thiol:disulfide interchange protein DsbE
VRRVVTLFSVAVLIAGLGWYLANRGVQEGPVAGVERRDEPLPALSGPALEGPALSTADFRGHILVVNVWATWCDPCRREQPALQRLSEVYADRGVRFLGINYADDESKARRWIARFRVGYPSLKDPSGGFADDLGFVGLPDTYVVDAGGTIRYAIFGETSEEEVSGLIDELLASGPA